MFKVSRGLESYFPRLHFALQKIDQGLREGNDSAARMSQIRTVSSIDLQVTKLNKFENYLAGRRNSDQTYFKSCCSMQWEPFRCSATAT
jgi:hypothetical protein